MVTDQRAEHVVPADGVVELVGQPEPVRGVPGRLARTARPVIQRGLSTLPVAMSTRATESPPTDEQYTVRGDDDADRLNQSRLGGTRTALAVGAMAVTKPFRS